MHGDIVRFDVETLNARGLRAMEVGDLAQAEIHFTKAIVAANEAFAELRSRFWGRAEGCPANPAARHRRNQLCGCALCLTERGDADSRFNFAMVLFTKGQALAALPYAESALSLFREQGRFPEEVKAVKLAYDLTFLANDWLCALFHGSQYISILDSSMGELRAQETHRLKSAIAEEKIALHVSLCSSPSQIESDLLRGSNLIAEARFSEAFAPLGRALQFARLSPQTPLLEIRVNARIGLLYHCIGRDRTSLFHFEDALRLARGTGNVGIQTALFVGAHRAALACHFMRTAARLHALALLLDHNTDFDDIRSFRKLLHL